MTSYDNVVCTYRVSLNAVYKIGGEIENIVRSNNYLNKHGQKAIGGAVRHMLSSQGQHKWFLHFRRGKLAMNMNRYTNAEMADIHFVDDQF
ncbi:hypothetical protein TNCV_1031481 [Trichonephila clavipes]|nr:hypothetical protein TNCV_1031481 [Trichonephila clavipes]